MFKNVCKMTHFLKMKEFRSEDFLVLQRESSSGKMSRDKLTFAMKQEKSVAFQPSLLRTEKTSPLLCCCSCKSKQSNSICPKLFDSSSCLGRAAFTFVIVPLPLWNYYCTIAVVVVLPP